MVEAKPLPTVPDAEETGEPTGALLEFNRENATLPPVTTPAELVTLAERVTVRDEALNEMELDGAAVAVAAAPMVNPPLPLLAAKFPPPE